MLLLRAKARPSKSTVKGNTLTIDRHISGKLEETLLLKNRRLNGKQPTEPTRRRLREKSLPTEGNIPAAQVAELIQKVDTSKRDAVRAIEVKSNGYLDQLKTEHEIELERTKTAMSAAANQIMDSMAAHYNQIIGNRTRTREGGW